MNYKSDDKSWVVNGDFFWPSSYLKKSVSDSLYDSLAMSTEKHPEGTCIIDDFGSVYSYKKFLEMTDNFAALLSEHYHVKFGSHVALLLYNSIEFCVAFFAISKLRAVAIPFPTKYKKEEIFSLIAKSDLNGIICDKDFYEWFHQDFEMTTFFIIKTNSYIRAYTLPEYEQRTYPIAAVPSGNDPAIIMFTSGTTSKSKGALLTNHNIMSAIHAYQKILGITEHDSTIIPIPIYHVTGLIALLGLFIHTGSCIHLHKFFDANRILLDISHFQITFLHASPTVFSLLLQHKADFPSLPSLRALACGSSNMPASKIHALHDWLPAMKFHTVYGLTETSSPACIFPDDAAISPYIGSSGHPIPGTSFKICNAAGNLLPPGSIGSILIKGDVVLSKYYNFKTSALSDGWLDTGDLGYFNDAGYLFIVDRKKDMINRGGEKICSFDVENALYSIPGITEAAVVGIKNDLYGEIPAAMVTLDPSSTLNQDSICALLKEKLAKYQIPVKIIISDSLPLTENLKTDKVYIRQLLSANIH
ncbi:class I adenylate-forming enzyme family protein [Novisyntrophococcus fermenticellae]|uniref:class I adenylate-forming enzyme family protein n=1 Tax=Novisyntrophococcus fermenticellae TaxID=2068655 RepID=UPI001E39882F|nr:class I adenylate-forming enzyme family protein [Novisyntrophococcus fermenticellae]